VAPARRLAVLALAAQQAALGEQRAAEPGSADRL
jgi:hypothetical protein